MKVRGEVLARLPHPALQKSHSQVYRARANVSLGTRLNVSFETKV